MNSPPTNAMVQGPLTLLSYVLQRLSYPVASNDREKKCLESGTLLCHDVLPDLRRAVTLQFLLSIPFLPTWLQFTAPGYREATFALLLTGQTRIRFGNQNKMGGAKAQRQMCISHTNETQINWNY